MTQFCLFRLLLLFPPLLFLSGCKHLTIIERSSPPVGEPGWLGIGGNRVRGIDYTLHLPASRLEATPPWVITEGRNPPLRPGKAVALAWRGLATKFTDSSSWNMESMCFTIYPGLDSTGTNSLSNRWYYQFEFRPPQTRFGSDIYRLWVLMDGAVVLPTADSRWESNKALH